MKEVTVNLPFAFCFPMICNSEFFPTPERTKRALTWHVGADAWGAHADQTLHLHFFTFLSYTLAHCT